MDLARVWQALGLPETVSETETVGALLEVVAVLETKYDALLGDRAELEKSVANRALDAFAEGITPEARECLLPVRALCRRRWCPSCPIRHPLLLRSFRVEPEQVGSVEVEPDHGGHSRIEHQATDYPDRLPVPAGLPLVCEDDLERPHEDVGADSEHCISHG